MSISGRKFLELNGTEALTITGHALARLYQRTGWHASEDTAAHCFEQARQIRGPRQIRRLL